MVTATVLGSLTGLYTASALTDNNIIMNCTAFFASAAVGASVAPMKSVKLKRQGDESTHVLGSYPITDHHYSFDISAEQYEGLLNSLETYQSNVHITGYRNCVHKVKEVLREHGIDLKAHIYDSPNRLRRELSASNNF